MQKNSAAILEQIEDHLKNTMLPSIGDRPVVLGSSMRAFLNRWPMPGDPPVVRRGLRAKNKLDAAGSKLGPKRRRRLARAVARMNAYRGGSR